MYTHASSHPARITHTHKLRIHAHSARMPIQHTHTNALNIHARTQLIWCVGGFHARIGCMVLRVGVRNVCVCCVITHAHAYATPTHTCAHRILTRPQTHAHLHSHSTHARSTHATHAHFAGDEDRKPNRACDGCVDCGQRQPHRAQPKICTITRFSSM